MKRLLSLLALTVLITLPLSAATITAGPGAGTGATITITGAATDVAGRIHLNTGTIPAQSLAVLFTVNFSTPYTKKPIVLLVPEGIDSFQLYGNHAVALKDNEIFPDHFVVRTGFSALQAQHIYYGWSYLVIPQ